MSLDLRFWEYYIICFVDILGFTKLSKLKPEQAKRDTEKFRNTIQDSINKHRIRIKEKPQILISTSPDFGHPQYMGISDAVFITMKLRPNSQNPEVVTLVGGLRDAMFECTKDKIPIRGSISIGKVFTGPTPHYEGPVLVGVPVTLAAAFEEQQEWIGISFVPETNETKTEPCFSILRQLFREKYIARWSVPTTVGLIDCWVLTWPSDSIGKAWIKIMKSYKKYLHGDRKNKPAPRIAAKYHSTIRFLEHHERLGTEEDRVLMPNRGEGGG